MGVYWARPRTAAHRVVIKIISVFPARVLDRYPGRYNRRQRSTLLLDVCVFSSVFPFAFALPIGVRKTRTRISLFQRAFMPHWSSRIRRDRKQRWSKRPAKTEKGVVENEREEKTKGERERKRERGRKSNWRTERGRTHVYVRS